MCETFQALTAPAAELKDGVSKLSCFMVLLISHVLLVEVRGLFAFFRNEAELIPFVVLMTECQKIRFLAAAFANATVQRNDVT